MDARKISYCEHLPMFLIMQKKKKKALDREGILTHCKRLSVDPEGDQPCTRFPKENAMDRSVTAPFRNKLSHSVSRYYNNKDLSRRVFWTNQNVMSRALSCLPRRGLPHTLCGVLFEEGSSIWGMLPELLYWCEASRYQMEDINYLMTMSA